MHFWCVSLQLRKQWSIVVVSPAPLPVLTSGFQNDTDDSVYIEEDELVLREQAEVFISEATEFLTELQRDRGE